MSVSRVEWLVERVFENRVRTPPDVVNSHSKSGRAPRGHDDFESA